MNDWLNSNAPCNIGTAQWLATTIGILASLLSVAVRPYSPAADFVLFAVAIVSFGIQAACYGFCRGYRQCQRDTASSTPLSPQ